MNETTQLPNVSDVVLRGGSTLLIRSPRPDDHAALVAFFERLSPESIRYRFFAVRSSESVVRELFDTPFEGERVTLIAERRADIVAVAHYFRPIPTAPEAEVAFAVADHLQGQGVGTRLLEELATIARDRGIEEFRAFLLPDNQRMLEVFLESGFSVTSIYHADSIEVRFPIAETIASDTKVALRNLEAAAASMRPVFEPRSIAVVGAGRTRGQLGAEILHHLINTGFTGSLHAVNPSANEIERVRSYPSVTAIPEDVDLAIIVVPASRVEAVIDDCVAKNVRAVVIISAGFGEVDPEGRAREQRILAKARSAGMRMVGPNCMGVINTRPDIRLHATFSGVFPPEGNVAMSTQSGALGLAVLQYAAKLGVGFSSFVSVGNKVDVSGNDLIQYWAEDPRTDVILLYLESFGNPKRFSRIAPRVSRKKPIIAVKSGRSRSGARAAASHTGALATSDAVVDDLFRQTGVIRTDTLEEMFDAAALLAHQPLPRGRRVAIITNAGGPGILAADACDARGLELAELSEATRTKLRSFLPPEASVQNPVDMIAAATAEQYGRAIENVAADPSVDAILVIYIPVLPHQLEDVSKAIEKASLATRNQTTIATLMTESGTSGTIGTIPTFPFPERAVAALARVTTYADWRAKNPGSPYQFDDIDGATIREIVDRALSSGAAWLSPDDAFAMLDAVRIPTVKSRFVRSQNDAVDAAVALGFPVAMKASVSSVVHKTEAGAIRLGVADEMFASRVYEEFADTFGDSLEGVVVQQMIGRGVETMLGVVRDPTFGHVLVFGSGGTLVELVRDASFRLHPLTDRDAEEMIGAARCAKLLRGYRGSPPCDESKVRDALLRLSALIDHCPEIAELDINPMIATADGPVAVDVRVRIEKREAPPATRRVVY